MPKLLFARPAHAAIEERQGRKLASSRHAPGDWIRRAKLLVLSWQGLRTTAIATALHCHPQTVRERLTAFNTRGLDGLGDRPGAGRKRRITEAERSTLVSLVAKEPPGRLVRHPDGSLGPQDEAREEEPAPWTLNALTAAAQARGLKIRRSQVRRILLSEGVRLSPDALVGQEYGRESSAQKNGGRLALHQPPGARDDPVPR